MNLEILIRGVADKTLTNCVNVQGLPKMVVAEIDANFDPNRGSTTLRIMMRCGG